jgi:hypothetical protein
MTPNETIDGYFGLKKLVHDLFGYKPDWEEIPLEDQRESFWMIVGGEERGKAVWADEPLTADLFTSEPSRDHYGGPIHPQRSMPKYVWRTPTHVMVSVDTQTDGNKFLMIFDASKECTDDTIREVYEEYW